jgi:hypothetical protein
MGCGFPLHYYSAAQRGVVLWALSMVWFRLFGSFIHDWRADGLGSCTGMIADVPLLANVQNQWL